MSELAQAAISLSSNKSEVSAACYVCFEQGTNFDLGAYIPYETEQWKRLGRTGPPPVFSTKMDTDKSYNYGIELGLRAIREKLDNPKAGDVAIILATHNEVSIDKAITFVEELGLGKKQEDGSLLISDFTANRLAFAQIYGTYTN